MGRASARYNMERKRHIPLGNNGLYLSLLCLGIAVFVRVVGFC
jgi:hypothetical protein